MGACLVLLFPIHSCLIQLIKNQEVSQNLYLQDIDFRFFTDILSVTLIKKIKKDTANLGNIAEFYNGIKTGDNKKFISDRKVSNEYKEIISGRDIERYKLKFNNKL